MCLAFLYAVSENKRNNNYRIDRNLLTIGISVGKIKLTINAKEYKADVEKS